MHSENNFMMASLKMKEGEKNYTHKSIADKHK